MIFKKKIKKKERKYVLDPGVGFEKAIYTEEWRWVR